MFFRMKWLVYLYFEQGYWMFWEVFPQFFSHIQNTLLSLPDGCDVAISLVKTPITIKKETSTIEKLLHYKCCIEKVCSTRKLQLNLTLG